MSVEDIPAAAIIHSEILDPSARASYSGNPGFARGAAEAHPIDSPEKSLLARPEVGEALEASYIANTPGENNLSDIDIKLARSGVKWLRENLDEKEARRLRQQVVDTKSRLASEEESRQIDAQNAAVREQEERQRTIEKQREAEAEAEEAQRRAAYEAQQAAYYAEFEQALSKVQGEKKDRDLSGLLALGKEIEIVDDSAVSGRTLGGFNAVLEARIAEYLADPDKLADDMLLISALSRENPVDPTDPLPAVNRYIDIISMSIDTSITSSRYRRQELSPEIVNKWLNILVDLRLAKEAHNPSLAIFKNAEEAHPQASGNWQNAYIGRTLEAYVGETLANTVSGIAHERPDELVDVLHMIAEQGLDPEDPVVTGITLDAMRYWFRSIPLTTDILIAATSSRNVKIQRKAIDLLQTAVYVDSDFQTFMASSAEDIRFAKYGEEEQRILVDIYSKYFKVSKHIPGEEKHRMMRERGNHHTKQFLEWIMTEEGAAATMYGRFASREGHGIYTSASGAIEAIGRETFLSVVREGHVNGIRYNNLYLNGPGVDGTYDPDVGLEPLLVAGYWPGGIGREGLHYTTGIIQRHAELDPHEERLFMRRLLKDATLDPVALERHNGRLSGYEKAIEETGSLAAAEVTLLCQERKAPLSYVMVSSVKRSKLIKVGERIATLCFPAGLPPEVSLKEIQRIATQPGEEENL